MRLGNFKEFITLNQLGSTRDAHGQNLETLTLVGTIRGELVSDKIATAFVESKETVTRSLVFRVRRTHSIKAGLQATYKDVSGTLTDIETDKGQTLLITIEVLS